jgi:hypothetical protein
MTRLGVQFGAAVRAKGCHIHINRIAPTIPPRGDQNSRPERREAKQSCHRARNPVSQFNHGLHAAASVHIAMPRLADSLVSLECKLFQSLLLGDNTFVIGEIVMMHVAD